MSTQITDEQVKNWLHEQRNAAGIPSLVLWISTEHKEEPFNAKIEGTVAYFGFGSTLAKAVDCLRRQMPEAREYAKKLRAEAERKMAQADAYEGAVPAAVIADKQGRAA